MKCQIQWIDKQGNPTPDENDAVMMAHFHTPKWSLSAGGVGNTHMGYEETIRDSFPICATHYAQVTYKMRYPVGGWSFTPIEEEKQ